MSRRISDSYLLSSLTTHSYAVDTTFRSESCAHASFMPDLHGLHTERDFETIQ
uniref:Uncharacterized protein n=1 Tax=Octopus bimaculoides TaxID=37653 RepID=A0A0L8FSW3_OCTBM